MVFSTLYHLVAGSFIVSLASLTVMNFLPNSLFEDFPLNPVPRTPIDFPSEVKGWNTLLSDKVDYIKLNQLLGPESIALDSANGLLYTGLADGRIVEINTKTTKNEMRLVTRMTNEKLCGKVIDTAEYMPQCGRPLQVKLVNETLYVMDAFRGLYSVNKKTGAKQHLMKNLDKRFTGIFNSFVFDPKESNLIYVTVSSTKWTLDKIVWSMFDLDTTGLVFAYDIAKEKSVQIDGKLSMPNGINVDVKRDQLIYSESSAYRVRKMSLTKAKSAFKSAKSGETKLVDSELLIPLTVGLPDNIFVKGDEAYISIPMVKISGKELLDHLSDMPSIKKALGRLMYSAGKLLEYVKVNFWSHPMLDTAIFELKSGHLAYRTFRQRAAVLIYNLANGSSRLLGADKFAFISEAVPDNEGNLYLGSFRNTFIAKVKV